MTQRQIELVKSSWISVAVMDHVVVGGLFYNRLFEIAPQLKSMFHNPIPEQSKKLLAMINNVIAKLDKLDDIVDEVAKLGRKHIHYGVQPEHYAIVGSALLWTLEKGMGENWNEEVKNAWTECYNILSGAMIAATEEDNKKAA